MPYIDPKALHEAEQDLDAYNDVELEPREGPPLIGPGEHIAVLMFGQDKNDDGEWVLMKLGMSVRTPEGVIKGHWWCRVYAKHAGRWSNLWATLLGPEAPPGNYRIGQFQGRRFRIRLGYGWDKDLQQEKTEGRLWPQRFDRVPPAAPAARGGQGGQGSGGGGGQQRAQNGGASSGQQRQNSGASQQPAKRQGYGQTYGGDGQRQSYGQRAGQRAAGREENEAEAEQVDHGAGYYGDQGADMPF